MSAYGDALTPPLPATGAAAVPVLGIGVAAATPGASGVTPVAAAVLSATATVFPWCSQMSNTERGEEAARTLATLATLAARTRTHATPPPPPPPPPAATAAESRVASAITAGGTGVGGRSVGS